MKRAVCLALAAGLAYGAGPDRQRAIERGLRFIYETACDPKNFARFGEDYVWCFYSLGSASRDPSLARMAMTMARERAATWRRDYGALPVDASAGQISSFIYGAYSAEQLGFPDPGLKERVRHAAARYSVRDYLGFDPARERPPGYGVWYDALTTTYFGDRYGVTLGAPFRDVMAWLPSMRPYPQPESADFYDSVYAVTHVIYTLNDYSMRRLSPRALGEEFAFLKSNMKEAIAEQDGEMLGEFLDTLKAFGLRERDPIIRSGVDYLLATQNPDGSWGDRKEKDVYLRYHPTWTAVGGLMRYKWEHR